jgi:hypothetical protein
VEGVQPAEGLGTRPGAPAPVAGGIRPAHGRGRGRRQAGDREGAESVAAAGGKLMEAQI